VRFLLRQNIVNRLSIGIDFKIKVLEVEGKKIKMQIWDTAGQERFKTITQTYYKGATGIILTYAVNNRESCKNIEVWMKQINEQTGDKVCKLLIGNKSDVSEEERVVEFSEGKQIAQSYGIPFFETSAKENKNVAEAFQAIAKDIKNVIAAKEANTVGPTTGFEKDAGSPFSKRGTKLNANKTSDGGSGGKKKKKGCC